MKDYDELPNVEYFHKVNKMHHWEALSLSKEDCHRVFKRLETEAYFRHEGSHFLYLFENGGFASLCFSFTPSCYFHLRVAHLRKEGLE